MNLDGSDTSPSQGTSQVPGGSPTQEPVSKRRRVALACKPCRTRKSRCDGVRPRCAACIELNFECSWVQSAASANTIVGKDYLVSIEDRLKAVEKYIASQKAHGKAYLAQSQITTNGENSDDSDDQYATHDGERHGNDMPKGRTMEVRSEALQDISGLEDSTDGMGAVVFSAEEDSGFFGPSSNIAFTRHISRAVAQLSHLRQGNSAHDPQHLRVPSGLASVSRPPSPLGRGAPAITYKVNDQRRVNIYALPPEDETRILIDGYFAESGVLFPYLHEQTFLETYEEMKRNNFSRIRRTWLGLLNMVLALATTTSFNKEKRAEERFQQSDIFYQRALGLCDKQILRGTSLEIVQYLLIMGQYLQGTQKSVQAWSIHGLAVKAAFQLGLHSSEASKRFSDLEREIRKRTWYGCVILDRTLSMTFGRPAAIPDDYVRIELPRHYREILGDVTPLPPLKEASVYFFNATINLYKILWNIINLFYGANIGCGPPLNVIDSVTHLFHVEQQLADWQRNLRPDISLRLSSDIPMHDPSSLEKMRIIITLRHHNVRALLHRPILTMFLELAGKYEVDQQEIILLQQIGSNSVKICAQSTMEIVAIISTIVNSTGERRNWLGAWWFSLYYTFNAALTIFASLLVVHNTDVIAPNISLTPQALKASFEDAVQALSKLDTRNRMVERCAKYLGQLAEVLVTLSESTVPGHVMS